MILMELERTCQLFFLVFYDKRGRLMLVVRSFDGEGISPSPSLTGLSPHAYPNRPAPCATQRPNFTLSSIFSEHYDNIEGNIWEKGVFTHA